MVAFRESDIAGNYLSRLVAENVDAECYQERAAQVVERCERGRARTRERDGDVVDDAPMLEDQHAIGEANRLLDVVRHEQHGGPVPTPKRLHEHVHAHARQRVERSERFVKQQQFRLAYERPRERGALRFAARERQRPGIEPVRETHFAERGLGLRAHVAVQTEGDVFPRAPPRQQARLLKGDRTRHRRLHDPGCRRVEPREHA